MHSLISNVQTIFLVVALSIDAIVVSASYGANKISIPILSALLMTLICTSSLAISLFLGSALSSIISPSLTKIVACSLLIFLGIEQLFDSYIKSLIKKNKNLEKKVQFKISDLKFVLNIYADPQTADIDKSKSLSLFESIFLATALSLDGLVVGFGTGLVQISIIKVLICSLIINLLAIMGGFFIGNLIGEKCNLDLSFLSGTILIILAVMTIK